MPNKFNIPVLFVFFNRPQIALQSFERIKKCQPQKLYLASDGARANKIGEYQIVNSLRETIISQIDWDCEVKTLFREKNVGCGEGVYSAINWLFESEESGIILEDDCVVQQSFFRYMQELLGRYKDDQRIGMIAGFNSLGEIYADTSYTFSLYKACWGWATWKRAWNNMDINMNWRKSTQVADILANMGYKGADLKECLYKLMKIDNHLVNAWDWQWYFSLASQNQLCIFPSVNLVSNIGFGKDATHTSNRQDSPSAYKEMVFPLKHPEYTLSNICFDQSFHHELYNLKRRIRNLIPIKIYLKAALFKRSNK